jgi:hypothetical protein
MALGVVPNLATKSVLYFIGALTRELATTLVPVLNPGRLPVWLGYQGTARVVR